MRFIVSALAAVALVAGASTVGASARDTHASVVPVKITVSMGEFYFKLTKKSVAKPAGASSVTVVFTVINKGQLAHDLAFGGLGKKTARLNAGQKQTLRVTFKKKGRYSYLCTVPRHANAGMVGVFRVT
jgi:uncharacterized cupredoxin-like copper-binding protein